MLQALGLHTHHRQMATGWEDQNIGDSTAWQYLYDWFPHAVKHFFLGEFFLQNFLTKNRLVIKWGHDQAYLCKCER